MKNDTVFVLLAGGKSERMGVPKGLLRYHDSYWILEQLNRISQSKIQKVFIGLGHDYQLYFQVISWLEAGQFNSVKYRNLDVNIIVNSSPEKGPMSTIQAVLMHTQNMNVLMNPIDVPLLNSVELDKINSTENTVVIPNYKGKNGHPIKLDAIFCERLSVLDSSDEMSRLDLQIKRLNPQSISKVSIKDPSILKNLNDVDSWTSYLLGT